MTETQPAAVLTSAEAERQMHEMRLLKQMQQHVARITSLTASLDDANRTIARLSSEKVELERVIATVKETVGGF